MSRILCLLAALLSGCATAPVAYRPTIDFGSSTVDQATFEHDLADCQALAQRSGIGQGAINGAALGALFGALLGAAIGGRDMIGAGARAGAVGGLEGGVVNAAVGQQVIVSRCMSGRGYAVVGP